MDYSTGKLSFLFIAAVALAFIGAWIVAGRYRAALARLMRAGAGIEPASGPTRGPSTMPTGSPTHGAATGTTSAAARSPSLTPSLTPSIIPSSTTPAMPPALPPATPVTLACNRRAAWRLSALLLGLSLLMALSAALLQLRNIAGLELSFNKLAVLGLLQLWPLIPALGVCWRWPRWKIFGAVLGWLLLAFIVVMWRSTEAQSAGQVAGWVAFSVGVPVLLVSLLCLGGSTRAAAPWLLPPCLGLVWASMLGIDLLGWLVEHRSPWLLAAAQWLDARLAMALFAIAPWLFAAWPVRWLARRLAKAYARKQLSELMVLFSAVWGVELLFQALSAASDLGWAGSVMLLPLLWIPVVMSLLQRWQKPRAGRAPTLLVLRVFQRDAATQRLFDDVIERWRLSGNTVLIAGTDLVDRTLDADDIFAFIDGELPGRFIRSEAEVAARIDAFDLAPDIDGRHRINECYCHDGTWQAALAALIQRSDVALMDLRGFQPHNAGCIHELGALARAGRLARAVLLTDAATDSAAAKAAADGAPPQRLVWLTAEPHPRALRRQVLAALFDIEASAPRMATAPPRRAS